MSLRARLLAGLGVVAVVLVVVATLITLSTRDQLIAQVDDRLESIAPPSGDSRLPLVPTDEPDRPELPARPERFSEVYEGVIDDDGTLRTRFRPNVDSDFGAPVIGPDDVPARGRALFTTGSDDGDHTYRVLASRDDELTSIVALPLDDVQSTVSRLVVVEVVGAIIILAALGVVAWWVIHLGIRPMKEMTATATRIAEGDVDVRIPDSQRGTESGELADALNGMLTTVRGSLDAKAASEERLRRFVADASHELRTPVTTIRGYAELYRHGGLDDADALDDAMRRTEQEAVRMGRLVEDMLTLAKLDEQRPLAPVEVDLAALVRDTAADARAVAPGRSIEVEAPAPVLIEADEDRVRQALANVVGNAVVHTDDDTLVRLSCHRSGGVATIEVTDDGGGMPPDVAERITERFFRADPARSRARGGSGLGLAIVDAIVGAHGGSVEIDSAPGAGTTVRLEFPSST